MVPRVRQKRALRALKRILKRVLKRFQGLEFELSGKEGSGRFGFVRD